MLYSRGNEVAYQKWSDLLEDQSWTYENVLPYFKKSENFTRRDFRAPIDVDYHGYDGPVHVSHSVPERNFTGYILEGSKQLGYHVTDYNGKQEVGATIWQYYIKDGMRFDSEMAFIEPARNRSNLKILDHSYVTKIVINETSKSATGVIFTRMNKTFIARCNKEVILSAGAISSPQILMLSGIGPEEHLKSLEIPVVQNLSVGEGLHDHTMTFVVFSSNSTNGVDSLRGYITDYSEGVGSFTRPFAYTSLLWFQTPEDKTPNYPNIEILTHNMTQIIITKSFFNWSDEVYDTMNTNKPNPFTFILVPTRPNSVGSVKLQSSDPFEYPLVDSNLLGDEEDLENLYKGVQLLFNLTRTPAMQFLNFTLAFTEFPGCNHTAPLSREYWYCYFRIVTGPGEGSLATCRTGKGPETGVVSNELKVFGINKLRVADASVIPFQMAAHPNSVCHMVGEKVSDLIKKEYNQATAELYSLPTKE